MPLSPNTITNVALTSNVVTITTGTNHGYSAGKFVLVSATTTIAVNGYFVIASTPGLNTFTYALTNPDIASVGDAGVTIPDTYEVIARRDIATIAAKTISQSGMVQSGTVETVLAINANLFSTVPTTGFCLILEAKPDKWSGQERQGDTTVQFLLYFSAPINTAPTLYPFENVWSKIRDDLANTTFWTNWRADEISVSGPVESRTDAPNGVLMIYMYTFTITFRSAAGAA